MKNRDRQYTIRGIPDRTDRRLREAAAQYGTSLNATAVDALARGLGLEDEGVEYHDLDDLAGTWEKDPEFDKAVADMDRVDEGMWG